MFNTGTRIIALASSLSAKTGPKRGSVGYVRDLDIKDNIGNIINKNGMFFDESRMWFLKLHLIYFVRYGFEKKSRIESKFFINLVPYLSDHEAKVLALAETSLGESSMEQVVDQKIKAVENFDPDRSPFIDELRYRITNMYGKVDVYTGMITPMPTRKGLDTCDIINFEAWLRSMLDDEGLTHINDVMLNKYEMLRNAVSADMLDVIGKMRADRHYREDFTAKVSKSPFLRDMLVTSLRKMVAIGERPDRNRMRKIHTEWFAANSFQNSRARERKGVSIILDNFYTKDKETFLAAALNNGAQAKLFAKKAEFLTALKCRMVSLARSMDEGVEVSTQTVNG